MSPVTMINKWYVAVEYKENHCDRFSRPPERKTINSLKTALTQCEIPIPRSLLFLL